MCVYVYVCMYMCMFVYITIIVCVVLAELSHDVIFMSRVSTNYVTWAIGSRMLKCSQYNKYTHAPMCSMCAYIFP